MPTDSERLDKLEALMWSNKVVNGLVLYPCIDGLTKERKMVLQDLGEADNLGEELTPLRSTLREAIDALI